MSNPPPVKTPLSEPASPAGTDAAPADESPGVPAATAALPDPKVAALIRLLRPVAEPHVHPDAGTRLHQATSIDISLSSHRLRVMQNTEVLVESPLATGRTLSPTPEGHFVLAAKLSDAPSIRYGHFRNRAGALLVRGVFPKIDSLPPDAVFDAIAPKAVLQLSEEGPLVFGGEATGAATTDGTLVLPDRIALLLHELLPVGLPVVIAP